MGAGPMGWPVIEKPRDGWAVEPNLIDYRSARATFTWEAARAALEGLPDGGLNIAHEAVTRHASGARRNRVALRLLGRRGEVTELTYGELDAESNRFANVLTSLGVRSGDRVFALAGRIPELYVAALGTLKARAVFCPLFSAFGPEPIRTRLAIGEGRVLVTSTSLYERKVAAIRSQLPKLEHLLLVSPEGEVAQESGTLDFRKAMSEAADRFVIAPTDPEEMALLHFTSGTTGTPKGAIHVHNAVVAHHATGSLALDLHDHDIFWCTADPGWVTGTSYGIISPLSHGITSIVDEGDFEAERWYQILQDHRVTVWYTAPTAIRMLMRAGADLAKSFDLSALRFIASVGEPLNPEAVVWGQEVLGLPIHDNWWQTETGGILIANYPAIDIRPGSMGLPLPGIDAAILRRDESGRIVVRKGAAVVAEPGAEGELAIRPGWPSMFRGYLHEHQRYRDHFVGGWYLTGDLARMDEDGYVWFVGRADDVIKSMGHLIGPFEVESALLEHEAVAEAAAIGKPDPIAGEVVKAFVSLKSGWDPSEALRRELVALGRTRLGAVVAPKEIEFRDLLPRTRSGKIMRRLLKAEELGQPQGDVSTLESS